MKNLFEVLWRAKQNDAGMKVDYEMIGGSLGVGIKDHRIIGVSGTNLTSYFLAR